MTDFCLYIVATYRKRAGSKLASIYEARAYPTEKAGMHSFKHQVKNLAPKYGEEFDVYLKEIFINGEIDISDAFDNILSEGELKEHSRVTGDHCYGKRSNNR